MLTHSRIVEDGLSGGGDSTRAHLSPWLVAGDCVLPLLEMLSTVTDSAKRAVESEIVIIAYVARC